MPLVGEFDQRQTTTTNHKPQTTNSLVSLRYGIFFFFAGKCGE